MARQIVALMLASPGLLLPVHGVQVMVQPPGRLRIRALKDGEAVFMVQEQLGGEGGRGGWRSGSHGAGTARGEGGRVRWERKCGRVDCRTSRRSPAPLLLSSLLPTRPSIAITAPPSPPHVLKVHL